jgi:transcription elongation factor GreA-like protein
MSNSLDMLRTEEGQLNAVFACFGSAAQHAQLFEGELKRFLAFFNKIAQSNLALEDLEAAELATQKKTMGALLRLVRQKVRFTEGRIEDKLHNVLEKRNFLIHHFFLERDDEFKTEAGRLGMLGEMVGIEREIETATGWIAGLRVAVAESLSGKDRSVVDPEEVVFSAEIDIEPKTPF